MLLLDLRKPKPRPLKREFIEFMWKKRGRGGEEKRRQRKRSQEMGER
jgi:hypothetical protein